MTLNPLLGGDIRAALPNILARMEKQPTARDYSDISEEGATLAVDT